MFKSFILGLVQAIAEFLPISSSGHLRIVEYFLNTSLQNNLSFEIALHFGTFLATVIIFYKDIINTISGFFVGLKNPKTAFTNNENFRMAILIVIATVPTAITGLLLEKYLSNIPISRIAMNIAITGTILLTTRYYERLEVEKKDVLHFTLINALIIGLAQSVAIFPGISRSGMTIAIALFLRANREFAGKFSFLISLPAIFGATLLSLKDIGNIEINYLLIGFLTAFVFGIVSLKLLLKFLKGGKLYYFGFYCITVGMAAYLFFRE